MNHSGYTSRTPWGICRLTTVQINVSQSTLPSSEMMYITILAALAVLLHPLLVIGDSSIPGQSPQWMNPQFWQGIEANYCSGFVCWGFSMVINIIARTQVTKSCGYLHIYDLLPIPSYNLITQCTWCVQGLRFALSNNVTMISKHGFKG